MGPKLRRYTPRAQMTSMFEGQPFETRPFAIKTRVIGVLGMHIIIILLYSCIVTLFAATTV